MFALVEAGALAARVGAEAKFTIDDVPRALDAVAGRRTVGKVVIVVADP
ncbi:zinc-binding dehydrogenase [Labilithrix luteola]